MADNKLNEGILTGCRGKCGHFPTVIIHGIGQSELYALDETGNRKLHANGKPVVAWPPDADIKSITKNLKKPLLKTLLAQKDKGFSDIASGAIADIFASIATGPDGNAENNLELVRYPSSVARCTPEGKDFIYSCIHLESYTKVAGEDHLYYFAYNSFGNNLSIAQELYDFIQKVKMVTGHDKINLAPISLGATIANSLLEFYPQVYDDLNRVVYVVPALDGSRIVGDIYTGNLSFDDKSLYKDLFPSFASGYAGYLMNILIRFLPKNVIHAVLDKTLETLIENVFVNCTVMWGLVPSSYYPQIAEKLLSDSAHSEIKRQTDNYHRAQLNSRKNIQKLVDRGISVFDVVDYNYPLYMLAGSWDKCNADGVIHLDSTSMGAAAGLVNTPLPDGYVQQNTYCTNPAHHHISPDGIVDASAGLLPDNTFYFRNQHHEGTGRNDVIIKLITELLLNNDFNSVYTMPERFPQFNIGREARGFTGNVAGAKTIDQSALSPADAAELQAAIEQADAMLGNTVVDENAYLAARERLFNIFIKIGKREPPSGRKKEEAYTAICKSLSNTLYKHWGPRGFFDWNCRGRDIRPD
ncbi:MAG: hypothetical protein WCN92_04950 [Eubacteriales bacterium]